MKAPKAQAFNTQGLLNNLRKKMSDQPEKPQQIDGRPGDLTWRADKDHFRSQGKQEPFKPTRTEAAPHEKAIFGSDLFGECLKPLAKGSLSETFLIPPFSVLNAREGDWQERKRQWLSVGIKSELGRGDTMVVPPHTWGGKEVGLLEVRRLQREQREAVERGETPIPEPVPEPTTSHSGVLHSGETGREWGEEYEGGDAWAGSGTSIFDPVLTELIYRWFIPPGGQIIDPFAGGSVRGIVASMMGFKYWGCDLRQEQIDSNLQQGRALVPDNVPMWVCGDSYETVPNAPEADGSISCPPYFDLEVYSNDPKDLSNMDWNKFQIMYRDIIRRTCYRIKDNRFACFVVGDVRNPKTGHYRDLISVTISAFRDGGMNLYNQAILVTSVGSLPVRVRKQFDVGRKMGLTHQYLLVFVKGDWRKAAAACNGEFDPSDSTVDAPLPVVPDEPEVLPEAAPIEPAAPKPGFDVDDYWTRRFKEGELRKMSLESTPETDSAPPKKA